jgi:hypothetical protein
LLKVLKLAWVGPLALSKFAVACFFLGRDGLALRRYFAHFYFC